MSQDDDEFKDVKKGLPTGSTAQKSTIKFIALYFVVAILVAALVRGFAGSISDMMNEDEFMLPQILMTGLLAFLVGSLQDWIFKSKIRSRLHFFLGFALLGGIVGGLAGGILMDLGFTSSSFAIGAVNGFLAGMISSVAQNKLMSNIKYGTRWFLFNVVSWAVIFSIAWAIAWMPGNSTNLAIAGAFLIIANGISLMVFLRSTPQIEFS